MDTSKEYIQMSAKAKELQTHKYIYGDCYSDDGETVKVVLERQFPVSGCVWLPRQDQLQEMVRDITLEKGNFIVSDLHYKIHHFYNVKSDYPRSLGSMEQLWLAFVMSQKYFKTWNGTEWK